MQHNVNEYDRKKHIKFSALTVKQPYADLIAEGIKTIEVRNKNTSYRGMLLITSSITPEIEGRSGITVCVVDLVKTEKIDNSFTDHDKNEACIDDCRQIRGYAWYFKNVRKVNAVPVKGQLGIYNLVMDKRDILAQDDDENINRMGCMNILSKIISNPAFWFVTSLVLYLLWIWKK